MTTTEAPRESAGGRVVLIVVLVLALLVGGGYAAAHYIAGDKVPRGTTVSGVDVGGLTADEAEDALREGLEGRAGAPIQVSVEGDTTPVDPADAGLSVDYAASVAAAGGGSTWNPSALWDYYSGGDDLDAVVAVDDEALDAAVTDLEAGLGTDPSDGGISFASGRAVVDDPVDGQGLDPAATRAALVDAFLDGGEATLEITSLPPDIDDADVQAALDDFATPALSGPVRLKFGTSRVQLAPRQYAEALALEPQDGVLVPSVDAAVLVPLVEDATAGNGDPVDATVALVKGKPRVVKAKPGITFDPDDVVTAFLDAVTKPAGEREIEVEGTVDQPDFTTRDARNLKIVEKTGEFTTYYPYAEYRNINIGRAAEIIDGTVLKPGETFSLNDIVGERTRENGFTEGFIISNGIFKEDLGGGVSQMATTTFNAMFFAGLKDIEHKPHSFYIDRYPVGREATVAWGSVDLRFENDTDYGVLVNAEVTPATVSTQGIVTVRMFSTKIWDVESLTSDRYAYVSPATRILDTPDCYPNTGYSGFQVDVTRVFRKADDDAVDHREVFHTDYTPSDTVICRPPGSLPG